MLKCLYEMKNTRQILRFSLNSKYCVSVMNELKRIRI